MDTPELDKPVSSSDVSHEPQNPESDSNKSPGIVCFMYVHNKLHSCNFFPQHFYCIMLFPSGTTLKKDGTEKLEVLLKPVGDAPTLKNRKWNIPADWSISQVSNNVRKLLKFEANESLVRCFTIIFVVSIIILNLYKLGFVS